MKLMKTMRKKSFKTVKIRLTPTVIYPYIPMIPQYAYVVCHGVPKSTTVPIPALPIFLYPWQSLLLCWSSEVLRCEHQFITWTIAGGMHVSEATFICKLFLGLSFIIKECRLHILFPVCLYPYITVHHKLGLHACVRVPLMKFNRTNSIGFSLLWL